MCKNKEDKNKNKTMMEEQKIIDDQFVLFHSFLIAKEISLLSDT